MKIKISITHWITGSVLFEYETENNTIKKTLEEAVSRGANLQGADLQGADLRGADLQGANLREADLQGANLREADLQGADLQGANLRGANLREADLRGANLWVTNLQEADLRGTDGVQMYWHIHHQQLAEPLTEPLKNRIAYIKKDKPKDEIKLRLKLLKKVKAKLKDHPHTKKGWEKLHRQECPNCTWDGKSIFRGEKGL